MGGNLREIVPIASTLSKRQSDSRHGVGSSALNAA
jgi:hypothetical protein